MTHTVVGIFEGASAASLAEQTLRSAGLNNTAIYDRDSMGRGERTEKGRRGGLVQFLRDLFGMDDHPNARPYTQAIEGGSCLLAVDVVTEAEAERARMMLEDAGALDVDDRAGTDEVAPAMSSTSASVEDTQEIPVVQEELKVGKRMVERGRVRIYTRTTELPVEQDVTLTEETVIVERRPVDRAASETERMPQEREFEVRTMAEEPVVEKTARVVEEVVVGKTARQHTETVRDRVRRTDVDVDDSDENVSATPRPNGTPLPGQGGRL